MDKGKGKEIEQSAGTGMVPVDATSSNDAQVINCDGKPAAVMITEKRTRSVTIHIDQECDNGDGDDGTGRNACKYRRRSMVWDHVTELVGFDSPVAECNYCKKRFPCDTSKNGIGHMCRHLEFRCPKAPENVKKTDPLQKLLSNGFEGVSSTVYNAELCRNALVEMVIIDEIPFRSVEADGFRKFCNALQPKFTVPSRQIVTRDCMKLYSQEKTKLKNLLEGKRICITFDTWTSVQNVNYMSLTAHFIDTDWVLHKKILNFCIVESHKGEALGKAVEACLLDWGIHSLFTVTLDNASANNVLVAHLKKKTRNWHDIICDNEFIHMRCSAYILNLVVNDGLKEASDSVERIRNAVRYVRSSPAKLAAFKKAAEKQRISSTKVLCLDVPTRWDSTYLMLEAVIRYQKAFESLEDDDVSYNLRIIIVLMMMKVGEGGPKSWVLLRLLILMLLVLLFSFSDSSMMLL